MHTAPPPPHPLVGDIVAGATAAPFAVAATFQHGWGGLGVGAVVTVLATVVHEVFWWSVLGRRQRHQTRLLDRGLTVDDVLRLAVDVDPTSRAAAAARSSAGPHLAAGGVTRGAQSPAARARDR